MPKCTLIKNNQTVCEVDISDEISVFQVLIVRDMLPYDTTEPAWNINSDPVRFAIDEYIRIPGTRTFEFHRKI